MKSVFFPGICRKNCCNIIYLFGLFIFLNIANVSGQNTTSIPLCTPPPVSVNPTNSLICNPGGAGIILTAFGALTYTWSPSTGLSATTGASVTANPAFTTTYTVTGTDGVGCTAIATAIVTVSNKPIIVPTATPATICSGNNSVLNANASMPAFTYCTPTYLTGTGSGDYISLVRILTTSLNNTTTGASSPYYTLYPASGSTTGNLVVNNTYTMNVKGGTYATCYIRGWIDYNQDGVFTTGETIGVSPNVGATTTGTIIFTVPVSAINGAARLRLRSTDNLPGPGTGDFCGSTNSAFGETEDYIINITGGVAQLTYLWSPATFLTSTTTNPTTASSVTTTTTYDITVTSFNGCSATENVPVTVPLVTVSNPAITTGTIGTAFSQNFTQTGAIGGATFTINSGTLPTGLTLSAAGILSGTPLQTGSFPVTVLVTDGNGCTGTGSTYTLLIGCQAINVTNPVIETGIAGTAISETFVQTGAIGGSTFTINSGTLPTGLILSAAGILSGTPLQTGSFPVTVLVTDGNGCTGTGITYPLLINSGTITVNLKLFLQGYYTSAGAMQPVLNNHAVPLSLATETDTITVELHHPTTFALIDAKKAVLLTNGTASLTYTQPAGAYYIAIRHRNTIETWSANAIACTSSAPLFDFSTAANKAYSSNQVQVETGIWALFTGDLNQDEFIDPFDFGNFDTDSQNGVNGVYVATDFNGDGFVDPFDFQVFDVNSQGGISSQHP